MDSFVIKGPAVLNGEIEISGSKNAALPIMTACLARPGIYTLNNVPDLRDTRTMLKLLEIIGSKISKDGNTVIIDTINCNNPEAPYDLVKTMRASFYVLGPLLSRFKYAKVSLPGGCAWGPRPIDYHLKAFEKLNAEVNLSSGYIVTKGSITGGKVKFPKPSVGATGNVIMACVNLDKEVIIENAAMEPEIVDLCNFLSHFGLRFKGIGTSRLTVIGVKSSNILHLSYTIIPDRIEAGTFMIACAASGGEVTLKNVNIVHLKAVTDSLKKVGVKIFENNNEIKILSDGNVKPCNIVTEVYPGFPTDLQAQWIALMCKSSGESIVEDTIYTDRFTHVPELIRLGANITMDNNKAKIRGVESLYSANVMSTDIRASACLIIAGIISKGTTHLSRIYHIDRGYESIENKLKKINANIKRI